ncbi:TonB family protein [Paremcibacter congregatus]|uniref:Protein TonB n=1 Tax=Paremcibacter congregatus TaxID=2043170 RepID=A0A2G4YU95_9PROT|nr:TonB family protein [Paremcibacter congregatus]PHZ85863.1 hypothetical protein CRD36_04075 [Paremcibacter congregatus]QDE26827.1 TonB family protein [Paremcibacter congregatus]
MRWPIILLLGVLLLELAPDGVAEENPSEKQKLIQLYDEYKTVLKNGSSDKSIPLAVEIYNLSRRIYGEKSKIHATAVFNLAQVQSHFTNYEEAAHLYQQHLDILEHLETPEDETYLFKFGLLAQTYRQAKELKKAVVWGKKALNMAKSLELPPEKIAPYELDLGRTYYTTFGKGGMAARYFEKAYSHFVDAYGEDHIKVADALFWQAKVDFYYHDSEKAAEKFERVRMIFERELSNGHHLIWELYGLLVGAYVEMGDAEKATQRSIAAAEHRPEGFDKEVISLFKVAPEYPYSAMLKGIGGHVIVEFTVTETGEVEGIKTIDGENIEIFEEAAHNVAAKFRYVPSLQNGKRVKTEGILHKITFEYRE